MTKTSLIEMNEGYVPAKFAVALDSMEEFYRMWYFLQSLQSNEAVQELMEYSIPSFGTEANAGNITTLADDLSGSMQELASSRGYLDINADKPAISTPLPNEEDAEVGVAVDLLIEAACPKGGSVSFSAPIKPDWLVLTDHLNGTATLSGTPGMADLEDHDFVVRTASSLTGLFDSKRVIFNVVETPEV